MGKTAIIKTGEKFFIKQLSKSQPIKLDKVIFANINGITGDTEIDLDGSMPDNSQIVHTAEVTQSGLLNDKTVVYSVILDTTVGDFSFNYIGLVNAETNTLCMVMHTDLTRKIKTAGQRPGNTITESIWLEIDNASECTGITVNAETWQIDYSKRLAGEDERIRLTNYDLYNRLAIHSGFEITKNGNQLTVSSGLAYVAGLRVEHTTETSINIENNQSLYIDAWLAGTTTGEWSTNYNLIAGTNLRDYEQNGFKHYVERIASVDASGNLRVVNPRSFVTTYDHASVDKWGIVKLSSATNSESETEAATPHAVKFVNDAVLDITDKFQSDTIESRMCSPDHRFYVITRNDGCVGMYNKLSKKLTWSFTHDGVLNDGCVPLERIPDLDEFVRYRGVPVGVPLPWPHVIPPAGWFECNGSAFNVNQFPRLGSVYRWGSLPDLRGEFIRGWDNGRGADPHRVILSWQNDAIRNIYGRFPFVLRARNAPPIGLEGAFRHDFSWNASVKMGDTDNWGAVASFDASRSVPVSHDNHPRNIAFMYIVKAE